MAPYLFFIKKYYIIYIENKKKGNNKNEQTKCK